MGYKRAMNSIHRAYVNKKIEDNYIYVEEINEYAQEVLNAIENIVKNTELISFDSENYYNSLYKHTKIEEYIPLKMESEKSIKKRIGYKREKKLFEKISTTLKNKRLEKNREYELEYAKVLEEYNIKEKQNKEKYIEYVSNIKNKDKKYNEVIDKRKEDFNNDSSEEIENIFSNLEFEVEVPSVESIVFDYEKRKAVLEIEFINPVTELDIIKGAKYIKSRDEIQEIEYNKKELESIFQKIVFNSVLSFTAKVWFYLKKSIDDFIVNGFVNKINMSTGKKEKYYFFSVKLEKDDIPFSRLKLLDGKSFLDSKNSRYKTPLMQLKKIEKYEFDSIDMMSIIDNKMDGFDFEKYAGKLLQENGFIEVKVTQCSSDFGVDVIAYKDDIKYAIQCKKYSSPVGIKAVQEVIGSKSMNDCHVAVVLTNSSFTKSAIELAEKNNVLLWDRKKLKQMIDNFENQKHI